MKKRSINDDYTWSPRRSLGQAGFEGGSGGLHVLIGSGRASKGFSYLEQSLQLSEALGKDEAGQVIAQALGIARQATGQAAAYTRQMGHEPPEVLLAAAAALRNGDPDQALEQVTEVLDSLADDAPPALLAMARTVGAQALEALGRYDEVKPLLETALRAADSAGEEQLIEILLALRDRLRDVDELERLAATPLAELRLLTSEPGKLAGLIASKATATVDLGRPDEARALLDEAATLAEQSGDPMARIQVLIHRYQFEYHTGEAALAQATLAEARAIARRHLKQMLPFLEELEQKVSGQAKQS